MHILLVSPYHGGSHQAWAEGYRASSAHQVTLLTLPAHFWKWRMHGGGVTLARRWLDETSHQAPIDLILATDLLDLTTFLALTRAHTAHVPAAVYMHENQLTYPLPDDPNKGPMRRQLGERDRHYAFINYASMLAADGALFNSQYHLDTFFDALPPFLRHYPEYNELDTVEMLRRKSEVLPVGINLRRFDPPLPPPNPDAAPLVLWNQRLEYDKNPEGFISVLVDLAAEGVPFRVALCGERFGQPGERWEEGVAALGDRVIHNGYADEEIYRRILWESAVTVSTAGHEYFGISIIEAIYARTFPLLPARLSYPELIPTKFHADSLYRGRPDLLNRLRLALTEPAETQAIAARMAEAVAGYDWSAIAAHYDERLARLAGDSRR
jgi:glycosyltransferase involved in cell wall biosynthesis